MAKAELRSRPNGSPVPAGAANAAAAGVARAAAATATAGQMREAAKKVDSSISRGRPVNRKIHSTLL